eukprot:jgi/Astpho2/4227/Aster-05187
MARLKDPVNSYEKFLRAVVSHALECTVIKKWNPDDALYVIFEEIKTSIKLSVVPPRLREKDMRVATLRKEEIVIDGSDPIPFDWKHLKKPLQNLHGATAEEVVEDEGDDRHGPTTHQRTALRASTDDQGLPTASTKRRTHRGPARRGVSDGGDANATAHRSHAAALHNVSVPAEAAGRCPKRQAKTPTSEPGPSSGDHSSLPPVASKRPKTAAQHQPAGAHADQQQAPQGGWQLNGQLDAAALDVATVVMHMYRKTHGI